MKSGPRKLDLIKLTLSNLRWNHKNSDEWGNFCLLSVDLFLVCAVFVPRDSSFVPAQGDPPLGISFHTEEVQPSLRSQLGLLPQPPSIPYPQSALNLYFFVKYFLTHRSEMSQLSLWSKEIIPLDQRESRQNKKQQQTQTEFVKGRHIYSILFPLKWKLPGERSCVCEMCSEFLSHMDTW